MELPTIERPMAGEQADSKTVRISKAAYDAARKVSSLRGIDLGAYISSVVIPAAKRDLKAEVRKLDLDD